MSRLFGSISLIYTYLLHIIMVEIYKIERWNEFNITSGDITTWGNKEIHELIIQFENALTSEKNGENNQNTDFSS